MIPAEASADVRRSPSADCHSGLYQLEDFSEEENVLLGEGPDLDHPLSSLEKLHLIAGYALSRKDIRHDHKQFLDILNYSLSMADCCWGFFSMFSFCCRDEIYCQICKQLVKNRNKRSQVKGWTLLSICLGIFPPTDLFMKVSVQRGGSAWCTP